jgi:hypothetical protein
VEYNSFKRYRWDNQTALSFKPELWDTKLGEGAAQFWVDATDETAPSTRMRASVADDKLSCAFVFPNRWADYSPPAYAGPNPGLPGAACNKPTTYKFKEMKTTASVYSDKSVKEADGGRDEIREEEFLEEQGSGEHP